MVQQLDTPSKTVDELGAALKPQHRLFVEHYFAVNLNQAAATRAAGYKDHRQGWRILQRPEVQTYVQARMSEYMPADEVMQRLTALARTGGDQFLKEEEYTVPVFEARPLQLKIDHLEAQVAQMHRIDPELLKGQIQRRQAEIADLEVQLALNPDATYETQTGTETRRRVVPSLEAAADHGVLFAIESVEYTQHGLKFKRQDNVRALELIGKHHKLFTDRTEHSGQVDLGVKYIAGLSEDDL
ncbi:terminase small subunit [Deinococcus aquatilis]|uniref:terminase small subunit n=1 Tax=Deinococcus aquatilis TaxID=519440 RepID=UPI000365B486|nr:terminase small subunit [Deinococcus aquatilis]